MGCYAKMVLLEGRFAILRRLVAKKAFLSRHTQLILRDHRFHHSLGPIGGADNYVS